MAANIPNSNLKILMARLRNPDNGCPWDLEQNFKSIAPHTIEEAYEVADAIENGTMDDLKDELGDLLFQIVFLAQLAEEQNAFTLDDVATHVHDKMVSRHPHVFGNQNADNGDDVMALWEDNKAKERADKGQMGALDGVALGLPALLRAYKLQKRAAKVGFDWPDTDSTFVKLDEEIAELKEAIIEDDQAHIEEEFGDILLAFVNLGRKLGINAEEAMRASNDKFYRRFKYIETTLTSKNLNIHDQDLEALNLLWEESKKNA